MSSSKSHATNLLDSISWGSQAFQTINYRTFKGVVNHAFHNDLLIYGESVQDFILNQNPTKIFLAYKDEANLETFFSSLNFWFDRCSEHKIRSKIFTNHEYELNTTRVEDLKGKEGELCSLAMSTFDRIETLNGENPFIMINKYCRPTNVTPLPTIPTLDPKLKSDIKDNLISVILGFAFANEFFIFGGAVRDWVAGENDIKDLDIGFPEGVSIKQFINCMNIGFDVGGKDVQTPSYTEDTNITNDKTVIRLTLTSLIFDEIEVDVDLVPEKIVNQKLDVDVNGLIMRSSSSVEVSTPNLELKKILHLCATKQFNIMMERKVGTLPNRFGFDGDLKGNHNMLMNWVRFEWRVAKRLNKGWWIEGLGKDENVIKFLKLKNKLIVSKYGNNAGSTLMHINDNSDFCSICQDECRDKYVAQTICCQNKIHYECITRYVSSRKANTEVPCLFCRGDIFGLKTTLEATETINLFSSFN